MTGQVVGFRLLNAVQVRNVITKLIDSGSFNSSRTKEGKESRKNKADVKLLMENAEIRATRTLWRWMLGYSFRNGTRSLLQDANKAFKWFKLSADAGYSAACTAVGMSSTSTAPE